MNIDINVYRARVGGFTSLSRRTKCKNIDRCSVSEVFLYILVIYFENFRSAIASCYHLFDLLTTAILITCFVFCMGLLRFNTRIPFRSSPFSFSVFIAWEFTNIAFLSSCIIQILLMRSGVEKNPGPPRGLRSTFSKLSFCHWNIDGLLARDGVKISYMESIVENYDFDIFAVGESTLSYKIPDDKLRVNGFTSPPLRNKQQQELREGY